MVNRAYNKGIRINASNSFCFPLIEIRGKGVEVSEKVKLEEGSGDIWLVFVPVLKWSKPYVSIKDEKSKL